MEAKVVNNQNNTLVFNDYPNLRIGFSTQDFQKAMPVDVASLTEIIHYAAREGYQFIMLRDELAQLTTNDCKALAVVAKKSNIDVIYEIHKNPLDSGYFEIFEKGLANTLLLPGPGIIRTLVSKSEFDASATRKGWNKDELAQLTKISEKSASTAKAKNVQFIVENFNEAFFGDGSTYFGLDDFFAQTSLTGLQFDISNPFRNTSRAKADPEKVAKHLITLGKRWVTTHLKTELNGEMQPILTDNPISVEKVVAMMGKQNIPYVTLELAGVTDKQQCYNNHDISIKFLKDKGILNM
jgi:hypothetical protein